MASEATRGERSEGSGPNGPAREVGKIGLEGRTWRRLARGAGVVVVAWVAVGLAPFFAARWLPERGVERVANVGQTFQVAESFFAALSAAGVAYALVFQAREQADSRRQAARDRRQAERSDARTARLTLLTALVEARAALVRTTQAAYEEAVRRRDDGVVDAGEAAGDDPTEQVEGLNKIRRDEIAELLALIHYAERVSGWQRKKAAHLPTPVGGDEVPHAPPLFEREDPPFDAPAGGRNGANFDPAGGVG